MSNCEYFVDIRCIDLVSFEYPICKDCKEVIE